ncbi:MAG: hypothetical protein AB7V13_30235 [Pseudorhodoplanes sp.]
MLLTLSRPELVHMATIRRTRSAQGSRSFTTASAIKENHSPLIEIKAAAKMSS